jgi:hypothetical protein
VTVGCRSRRKWPALIRWSRKLVRALERHDERLYGTRYGFSLARKRPTVRIRGCGRPVINEARFRGYDVSVTQDYRNAYDAGSLVVAIGRDDCQVQIYGDTVTAASASGDGSAAARRNDDVWTDLNGAAAEQRLGEVFTRIEQHAEQQIEQRACGSVAPNRSDRFAAPRTPKPGAPSWRTIAGT